MILEIQDVHAHYGSVHALQGVSLGIHDQEIVAVLGANGAGKTTLLSTVMGILVPSSGLIQLKGKSIVNLPPHHICAFGVGFVPEGRRVFSDLTVSENLAIGAFSVRNKSLIQKKLQYVFGLFPLLKERKKQLAGTLSGGEQQMLTIGRALMSNPKLLLLDEPSLGLAPLIIKDIFKVLKEINQDGTTVLLVEQSAYLALKVAHRAYIMESGRITLEGQARELAASDSIKKAYLGS